MFSAPPDVKQIVCHASGELKSTDQKEVVAAGREIDAADGVGGSAVFVGINSRYFLLAAVPQGDQAVQCLGAGDNVGSVAAIAQWDTFVLRPALDSCVPNWLRDGPAGEGRRPCGEAEGLLGLTAGYDMAALMAAHSKLVASMPETKERLDSARNALAAKRQKDFAVKAFLGPKDIDQLKSVDAGLDDTIDFWILGILCKPMLWLMRLSYSWIPSWGVAIIFLTLRLRLQELYIL